MIYSPRLKKILEYCLERDEYVSVETLANLCKTSTRTIFRELKDIDYELKEYDLRLSSKQKAGLSVEGTKEQKDLLLKELKVQEIAYLDKEERRNMLIFELLHSEDLEKLIHYANMFQVSEATISNDLDIIEPWFQKRELTLIRKPGFGVRLEGNEADVRKAITSIVQQSLQQNEHIQSVNFLDSGSLLHQIFIDTGSQSILKLLDQDILTRILKVFETYQHELSLDRYASVGYIGLIIHLVIAIDRIAKHEEIQESSEVLEMVVHDPAYQQAEKMAHYLEIEFDIDIPEVETAFIALHIKGAKMTRPEDKEHANHLKHLIMEMLMSFDEEERAILLQDEELMKGLLTHMEPTITRLKNDLPIYNPLKETIQTMYHELYLQTKRACQLLEKEYDCIVSEDEIAFLTMHIGASIERGKQERRYQRNIACGVVCASGIGVSALLSARILKAVPHGIQLKTLSMEDITTHQYQDQELLISTFDLDIKDIEVLRVTPLLNEEDMMHLMERLKELWDQPTKHFIKPKGSLLYMLKDAGHCAVELLESMEIIEVQDQMSISDMIDKIASCFPWETQVKEALMKREEMGSVIMEDMGFMLLHAKVADLNHAYMKVLYPKGSSFQTYGNIQFVMVMLLPQNAIQIQQQLCSSINRAIIEQEAFYKALAQRNVETIKEQVQMIEETTIREWIPW